MEQQQQPVNPKPICTWTHSETLNLIQAYQEKWYSLNRGQLKSTQWEEIAVSIAVKCGYAYSHPSAKSPVQCRHKMEKLRRRYRSEKQAGPTAWPYFFQMDCLETGKSVIIAATPISQMRPDVADDEDEDENDDDDDVDDEEDGCSKLRSINYILRKPTYVNRFSSGVGLKRERSDYVEEVGVGVGAGVGVEPMRYEEGRTREEEGMGTEMLAAEVRRFSERMVKIEKQKMEMIKETERWRMEMEDRKVRMILDSQSKVVDIICNIFRNDDDDDDDDGGDHEVIKNE
ncbi:hypothetical protein ACFE04_000550 [Oxalis oulophora]